MFFRRPQITGVLLSLALLLNATVTQAKQDDPGPLGAWKDGPAKKAIVDFVQAVTDKSSPQYVPPAQRIATFDQDGTLWVEQPIYTQVAFAFDRIKALSEKHADWKTEEPYKAILDGDREAMAKFTLQDLEKILAVTHSGMTVDEYHAIVKQWLATARHPRFKVPYTQLVYEPMVQLMKYLRENEFKTYIVTGGGQEFVRVYAEQVYGVPPDQVVGSAGVTKYEYQDGKAVLIKVPKVLLIDDKGGKPEGINLFIGRRPIAAFGNSTGDQQMLEYTQAGGGARLMMLVHHDDAAREYEYGAKSKIGTFSDALMDEAHKKGWTVISMKNDWRYVFAYGRGW